MRIILSPVRMDSTLSVYKEDQKLTINGELFDFSPMGEGDTLPDGSVHSEWVVGDVNKYSDGLELKIVFPIPFDYTQEQAFPVPLENIVDGLVPFPKSESQAEQE